MSTSLRAGALLLFHGLLATGVGAASVDKEGLRSEITEMGVVCEEMCKAVNSYPNCQCPGFGGMPANDDPNSDRSCVDKYCHGDGGCPNEYVMNCIKEKTTGKASLLKVSSSRSGADAAEAGQLRELRAAVSLYSKRYAAMHAEARVGSAARAFRAAKARFLGREVPTAGQAVGDQTGVDVPNPHDYTGAAVGGGVISLLVQFAIFGVACYYVWKWHNEMKEQGKEPGCGIWSALCCLCCTPITICFPIDDSTKK